MQTGPYWTFFIHWRMWQRNIQMYRRVRDRQGGTDSRSCYVQLRITVLVVLKFPVIGPQKAKQSLYGPIAFQEVEPPRFLDNPPT